MKRNFEFRRKTPVITQKEIIQSLIQKSYGLLHSRLWLGRPDKPKGDSQNINRQ